MLGIDAEDALEVAAAEDQQPIEGLATQAFHPALGVRTRPWRPHRRRDHTDALGAQDLVEACRELAVSVADQEAHCVSAAFLSRAEVEAGLDSRSTSSSSGLRLARALHSSALRDSGSRGGAG
jgi:hypothetical protein